MRRRLFLAAVATTLGGCATHAATSGRVVVRDDDRVVDIRFSDHDRGIIEDYYRTKRRGTHKKAPPGLAKRDVLPPGLAKRDTLPPGLAGRVLPSDLESRLSVLPGPYVRIVVGADIVLMNRNTRVIMDVMRGIATE